jgi:hypothetical protein
MTTTTDNGGYDPATRTTRKFVYTATAPDGATLSRTSERSYPFAVAVLFGAKAERTMTGFHYVTADQLPAGAQADDLGWDRGDGKGNVFKYEGELTYPPVASYWKVVSFHGTRKAAEKASPGYSNTVRKIVVPTTSVEKITRHR